LQELITAIRDTRNKNQLKPKDTIGLWIDTQHHAFYEATQAILARQVNAAYLGFTDAPKLDTVAIVVQTDKLYIHAENAVGVDKGAQKEALQKDLDYLKGFLVSVDKKLGNEKFVANAKPEVIANEQKKKDDALAKIKTIEESLALIG